MDGHGRRGRRRIMHGRAWPLIGRRSRASAADLVMDRLGYLGDTGHGAARSGRRMASPHARPAAPLLFPHEGSRHEAAVAEDEPARSWDSLPEWLPPARRRALMDYPSPDSVTEELARLEARRVQDRARLFAGVFPTPLAPAGSGQRLRDVLRIFQYYAHRADLLFGMPDEAKSTAALNVKLRAALKGSIVDGARLPNEIVHWPVDWVSLHSQEDQVHSIAADFLSQCHQSIDAPTLSDEKNSMDALRRAAIALDLAFNQLGPVGALWLERTLEESASLASRLGRRDLDEDWHSSIVSQLQHALSVAHGGNSEGYQWSGKIIKRPSLPRHLRDVADAVQKRMNDDLPTSGKASSWSRMAGDPRLEFVFECGRFLLSEHLLSRLTISEDGPFDCFARAVFLYAFGDAAAVDETRGANLRYYVRAAASVANKLDDLERKSHRENHERGHGPFYRFNPWSPPFPESRDPQEYARWLDFSTGWKKIRGSLTRVNASRDRKDGT